MNLTDADCGTCWIGGKCHRTEDCRQFHSVPLGEDGQEFLFRLPEEREASARERQERRDRENAQFFDRYREASDER